MPAIPVRQALACGGLQPAFRKGEISAYWPALLVCAVPSSPPSAPLCSGRTLVCYFPSAWQPTAGKAIPRSFELRPGVHLYGQTAGCSVRRPFLSAHARRCAGGSGCDRKRRFWQLPATRLGSDAQPCSRVDHPGDRPSDLATPIERRLVPRGQSASCENWQAVLARRELRSTGAQRGRVSAHRRLHHPESSTSWTRAVAGRIPLVERPDKWRAEARRRLKPAPPD
jgi:hypothetical protein